MNGIEAYINSVYKNVKGNSNEVEDLKQEMRGHLLQTVEELKVEGKTEEESIDIAISRFGELGQVENELEEVFKVQRKFATTILIIAIVALFFSAICFISYKVLDKTLSLRVPDALETAVKYKLKTGEKISYEEVNKLLTKYKKQFRYVALYKENSYGAPDTIYPSNFSVREIQNDESTLTQDITSPNGTSWAIRYGFNIKGFHLLIAPVLLISAIIFFVTYWLLFGIWCVINAYHRNKLSLAWIILFFLLNVVAYAIFVLDNKNDSKVFIGKLI